MAITIKRVDPGWWTEHHNLLTLDRRCMPGDTRLGFEDDCAFWWLAHDDSWCHNGEPVAYAGLSVEEEGGSYVYLKRSGVLKNWRGQGLQRRLIHARLRFAQARGIPRAVTYTMAWNTYSANNLIAKGFRMYKPSYQWAGDYQWVNYWEKML